MNLTNFNTYYPRENKTISSMHFVNFNQLEWFKIPQNLVYSRLSWRNAKLSFLYADREVVVVVELPG